MRTRFGEPTGSPIAVVPGGYRLVDRAGKPSGITVTDSELGVGRTIKDLRASSLEAAEDYEDTVELILALLSDGGEDPEGEILAAEARVARIVIADAGMTDDPNLTADEVLRHKYRRKVWLQEQLAPVRAAAETATKNRRENEARERQKATRLAAIRAAEAAQAVHASIPDDEWAEVWETLRPLHTALVVDFIEKHLTRAYGQPPVSFEDWARLRWARGLRDSAQLGESYLKQLHPRSGRPAIQHFSSWVERKWIEHRARPASARFGRPLDRTVWEAQTIAGRTEKRRTDARQLGANFAAETSMDDRAYEDGMELK